MATEEARTAKRTLARRGAPVWPVPIALAIITVAALLLGLVGEGIWDVAACIGLGVPVAVCLWFGLRRPSGTQRR